MRFVPGVVTMSAAVSPAVKAHVSQNDVSNIAIPGPFMRPNTLAILFLSIVIYFGYFYTNAAYAQVQSNFLFDNNRDIYGWAYDTEFPTASLNIEVFLDGNYQRGTFLGSFVTNDSSDDVNQYFKISGVHRFNWQVPALVDSKLHFFYVYATDGLGNRVLMQNGPLVYPVVNLGAHQSTQILFDASKDGCDKNDFPDHPARAFRTADGKVTLLASWIYTRRFVGVGLNALKHDCKIVYTSTMDQTYEHFDFWQWLQSPYTLDGQTIYNVTHNEYYAGLIDHRCATNWPAGWISSLTLTVSHDMGNSFQQPFNYLIRYPQSQWSSSFPCTDQNPTRYGDLGGSNIISKNGYYYKYFYYEPDPQGPTPTGWQCLMRTQALGRPQSWHVLTATGWYNDPSIPCMPILGDFHFRSVTFNTYLQKYVAILQGGPNFFFCLSDNLVDWTSPTPITMPNIDLSQAHYPVLLDNTDTSMNFENTGRLPFLYFSTFTETGNRVLMRVRVRFDVQNGDPNVFPQDFSNGEWRVNQSVMQAKPPVLSASAAVANR